MSSELDQWEIFWLAYNVGPPPTNVSSTLKAINFPSFENIKVALRILGTLPVTSCECERSFSAMGCLKIYKRSTMVADHLNGLALMHVHKEIKLDVQRVIDRFSVIKKHRLDLAF